MTRSKRCVVAYATPARQYLWSVTLAAEADVGQALAAARPLAAAAGVRDISWEDAPVGIFGELCARSAVPLEGDRIEVYRPLEQDPRRSRRERAQQQRRGSRRG